MVRGWSDGVSLLSVSAFKLLTSAFAEAYHCWGRFWAYASSTRYSVPYRSYPLSTIHHPSQRKKKACGREGSEVVGFFASRAVKPLARSTRSYMKPVLRFQLSIGGRQAIQPTASSHGGIGARWEQLPASTLMIQRQVPPNAFPLPSPRSHYGGGTVLQQLSQ
ncbi:hypothetical protein F5884DRAFT_455887 [Xylogone sp. PMI_703]|nr:hypothetical protein F5884DRAFT_455887 [Xylogone sp. PMI_703]